MLKLCIACSSKVSQLNDLSLYSELKENILQYDSVGVCKFTIDRVVMFLLPVVPYRDEMLLM